MAKQAKTLAREAVQAHREYLKKIRRPNKDQMASAVMEALLANSVALERFTAPMWEQTYLVLKNRGFAPDQCKKVMRDMLERRKEAAAMSSREIY